MRDGKGVKMRRTLRSWLVRKILIRVLAVTLGASVVACVACSESSSSETQAKYPDLTGIEAIQIVKDHLAEKEFSYLPPSKPSECKDDTSGECTEEPVRVVGYCRALVESGGIWSVVHLAEYSLWRVRVARSEPFWGDTVLYWDLYQHTGYVNPASTQIKC